ncbi:MAG: phosphomannomutase/phosphoglucomutase [Nanohaloarchaea archaeon]|nr:phosphomannomutase/phosphoglucomutase [Candidatus Nanohaloarchaea archaeon]
MTSFFHTYDLRGKHPSEIGVEEAEKIGKAYGSFTDAEEVLIGRDGRKHSEKITEAFVKGIRSTGTDVVSVGMVPSPVVYFAQCDRGIKSAAVVTASHNPPEYTGFKFCKKNAKAMSRSGGMKQIQALYKSESFETGEGDYREIDVKQDYINAVSEKIGVEGLDVAVNFGNAVTSVLGREMLEEIGCNVNSVNKEIDGDFPNHLPDPTQEEAREALKEEMEDEDLGIIFDGDGDRAGFIVPDRGHIEGDELIALYSEESLRKREGKILHDLRASKLVPEIVEENGGEPIVTRVGHTFFSEEIHEDESIVFAGELSGHFYFPTYGFPWDDGLFAAALMCKIASEADLKQKLEDYPDYPVSPELRIDCPEGAKQPVIEQMKLEYSDHDLSTVDGVKVGFEKGWALIRPSSTEEKMSVRVEADTEEDVERLLEEVENNVREFIEEAG